MHHGSCLCGGVAMGSPQAPTGVMLARHIFTADKGDYYQIPDNIPQSETS